jgi:peptide/nickel transport system ATP-binding protein
LLREIQRQRQVSYLFISHNLAVVEHMADEVGVMYLGRIVERRNAAALFAAPAHPYTLLLIETVPSIRRIGLRRNIEAGEVADPMRPPPGCAFHPRCRLADERCRTERPELLPTTGGVVACHAAEEGRLQPGVP